MAVQKRNFLIPLVPLTLIALAGIVAANATFRYQHPMHPEAKFTWGDRGGPRLVVERDKNGKQPKAVVVGSAVYEFGTLDPHSHRTHAFIVRNDGDAPLRLGNGGSTCKCATANIDEPLLQPGDQTSVEVTFNTGRDRSYSQTARVTTNDPSNRTLKFHVRGEVKLRIAAQPQSVVFGTVPPTAKLPRTKTLIHSRTLSDLTLLKVEPTVELDWSVAPATTDDLEAQGALSGFWIEMTPPDLGQFEPGVFTVALNITAEGVDNDGEIVQEQVRAGFGGELTRRFTVYGEAIDGSGLITLGDAVEGQSKRSRLIVKIRDDDPVLHDVRLEVRPAFVQTIWTEKAPGLYLLDLVIPADAPVGDYSGSLAGFVKVHLEHHAVRDQEFKLELDVLPKTFRAFNNASD